MATEQTRQRVEAVELIARQVLGLESLKAQGRDSLDFSEQAVWTLRRALEAAYEAGRNSR